MPEVIFLDAAGTLIDLVEPVGPSYSRIASAHGFHAEPQQFDAAFRVAWKGMPLRPPVAGPRPDDDRGWWRELVGKVFDQLGCTSGGAEFEDCFAAMYAHFSEPGVWALFPEAKDALSRLSKHHRLAVVSNFDGRLHRILADLGVARFFEQIVVSSEVGADKPHRELFEAALEAMNARPETTLHVGDDPVGDWQGAASADIPVFRLQRPGNSLASVLSA